MITAMRFMAGQTVFFDRRMFPHERPSLIGMACITEFVNGIRFELFVAKGAVNIVAAAAFDQAFFYGMMRLLVCLRPYIMMTSEAQLRFFFFQIFLTSGMWRMTVIACNAFHSMFAHIPRRHLPRLFMTGQTFCIPSLDIDILAEIKYIHAATSALFHMLRSGTMAGFAGILAFGPLY
jgi:hypothetical protein